MYELAQSDNVNKTFLKINTQKTISIIQAGTIGYGDAYVKCFVNLETQDVNVTESEIIVSDGSNTSVVNTKVRSAHIEDGFLFVSFVHSLGFAVWKPCVISLTFTLE